LLLFELIIMLKGISPLIAAVLLIAFTMAIGGVLFIWSGTFSQQRLQSAGDCSFSIFVTDPNYDASTNMISFRLRNTGKNDLVAVTVSIIYSSGNNLEKINLHTLSGNGQIPLPGTKLSKGEAKTVIINITAQGGPINERPIKIEVLSSTCPTNPVVALLGAGTVSGGGTPTTSTTDGSTTTLPSMQMATGSYIGNGTDNTIISLGFQPEMIIIKDNITNSVFKTTSLLGDATLFLGSGGGGVPAFPYAIQSLDVNGFTLGTNDTVNNQSIVYHWIAFRDNGANIFTQGKYIGNGTAGTFISTPFSPDLVWIKHDGTIWANAVYRDSLETGDQTHEAATTNGYQTNRITALNSTGFTIGDQDQVNKLGDSYYYFAFRQSNQFKIGSYIGDGSDNRPISGIGFQPSFVHVQNATVGAGGTVATFRTSTMSGDSSAVHAGILAVNKIQAFLADGFQIGTHAQVNAQGSTYHYLAWRKV